MVNDIRIIMAIVMYLVGCFSLMVYNAIVILRKYSSSKAMLNDTNKWISDIHWELTYENDLTNLSKKHEKRLLKKLKRVERLIAFSNALSHFRNEDWIDLHDEYIDLLMKSKIFHTLTIVYSEKKNEERAYFAYFISQYPQLAKNTEGVCTEIVNMMVAYIDNSDIYCRANVLKALCRIGYIPGIVNILQFFSANNHFMHHRLLAEDLFNFAGDKEVLALYLWGKYKTWNDNIMLGVVTFITMFSDGFKDAFLPVLKNKSTGADIRLAITRYYKEYSFEPAQPVLVDLLSQTENYEFATEAASALCEYPGYSTTIALVDALKSDNWHTQYSAAHSLVTLNKQSDGLISDLISEDSNAQQILKYMLEHASNEQALNVSEIII